MSKEQRDMMDSEDKRVDAAKSPLTHLFRMVLAIKELKVSSSNWNTRLTRFLHSPWSRVPKNSKDIGQERNNFNRAIARSQITFRTFQKAIQILGPVRYSMSISMEMRDGRVLKVETPMFLNPYADIDKLKSQFEERGEEVADADIEDYDREEEAIGTTDDLTETMERIPEIRKANVDPRSIDHHRAGDAIRRSLSGK
ncbi:hypothetical protein D3C85_13770 [compost metagenome]